MNPSARLLDDFLRELAELEEAYVTRDDPIEQSGFSGGPERWRAEREPIFDGITRDGDLLDVGCANGYLLECLVEWGCERGVDITPFGLDQGARLIEIARRRQPHVAGHFYVGNAWDWQPPRRFQYVYTLLDCVPQAYESAYLRRLLDRFVKPGGRLIAGDYGSRSRDLPARDVATVFEAAGLAVAGTSASPDGWTTRFAWVDRDH